MDKFTIVQGGSDRNSEDDPYHVILRLIVESIVVLLSGRVGFTTYVDPTDASKKSHSLPLKQHKAILILGCNCCMITKEKDFQSLLVIAKVGFVEYRLVDN